MTAAHTGIRIAAVVVLVVGLALGLGTAVLEWSQTTHDDAGDQCATAWHFHPGSGYLVSGGELTDANRQALSDQCDQSGATAWRTGWFGLAAGVAVSAVGAATLIATRTRQSQ